jgi:drug/metabolite transporter (DMT)-like permease
MNAIIAILIAALSFSFYPLLNTIAMQTIPNYLLALLVQLATALISFLLLVFALGSAVKIKNVFISFWQLPWDLKIIPLLSGTGIFAGGLFFIFALDLMTKTGATLIMECWPLLAIIASRALLTDKTWESFTLIDLILMFMTFFGLALITASEAGLSIDEFFKNPIAVFSGKDNNELLGVLLAILSAVCFAWAGVSRSYFASKLPESFRLEYFGKNNSIAESNFTYMLTYIFGIPSALLCFYMFEYEAAVFTIKNISVTFLVSISLVVSSVFYSYSLLIATNANINLLWYTAPLLATIWLIIFGYSFLTPLIIIGGTLIIFANLILILVSNKKNKGVHHNQNAAFSENS